jgi:hypothetical protein
VAGAAGAGALAGAGLGWIYGLEAAGAAGTGGALVPMTDAAFNYGTIQTIAGYETAGVIGVDGAGTYTMNIWGLYETEASEGLFSLANAIRAQAAAAGATDISIMGTAIINPGIANMSVALAARLGFALTRINATTILLQGSVF